MTKEGCGGFSSFSFKNGIQALKGDRYASPPSKKLGINSHSTVSPSFKRTQKH
jgi:hypothetical protein